LTWVGYGPFFVAKEKGYFEKHGLDVDIVKIEELGTRHSALISKEVQFSISTLDLFANEAAQGLPAVCIVKLTDSYGADGIVAKKEIKSVKDLKGKTIAFEKANPSHFFLIYLLNKEGLSVRDITPKYMTAGDAGAAFVAGQVDAAVTWEPWLTKANQTEFGHILMTSREKSGLLLDVLLVHKEFAQSNPEAVKGILKAWFDAVEFSKRDPLEANRIMAKGLGLSVEEFVEMLKGDKPSDYMENRRYFGLDSSGNSPCFEVFDQAQKIWMQEGLINTTTKPENAIDASFLRDLYK
jgi:NitT/TauT family transport system substrate-binding protein